MDEVPDHPEDRRTELRAELLRRMTEGLDPWPEELFDALAVSIFRYQCAANPIYGRFVRARGVEPERVTRPDEIPAVPARGFKDLELVSGEPSSVERVFRTSGTTRTEQRGHHHVRDLSIYRTSLLTMAGPMLGMQRERAVPAVDSSGRTNGGKGEAAAPANEIRTKRRILIMTPDPTLLEDSSLAFMFGTWTETWGDGEGGFFADPDWRLDSAALEAAVVRASRDGIPTLVGGTAFSFVNWLDGSSGALPPLPPGSVVVETGGFKGRSRRVERTTLYSAISGRLGVPVGRIVNEYGMTEMLSQFYEPVIAGSGPAEPSARWHVAPPWVRTRIVDPRTLDPVEPGAPGLLSHLDLANLDSVCAILTEDLGIAYGTGFRLLGRAEAAEPRGCSLAADILRQAADRSTRREG